VASRWLGTSVLPGGLLAFFILGASAKAEGPKEPLEGALSKAQVAVVVRSHLAAVKHCYDQRRAAGALALGGVEVSWRITSDGQVVDAEVSSSSTDDPKLDECIVRQVRNWTFPAAKGETVVRRFPFQFKERGGPPTFTPRHGATVTG
jgi:TonB family protein